jgi:MMP 1-O-methyltransferase
MMISHPENLHKLADNVKGFLDHEEGLRLYEIARDASRSGPCLEIGSYCGKSAIYLGAGCRENNGILFSIDHHRGSEEQQPGEAYFDPALVNPVTFRLDTLNAFRNTLEATDLENTVVPIVSCSEVAARSWKTPLSLVFIDGGHSDASAAFDYHGWAGFLKKNGYLLIHDIFKDPAQGGQAPYRVYQEALMSGLYRELPMTRTLGVLQRVSHI